MTPTNNAPALPAPKTLSGVLERSTYQNKETGYTVARLLPDRKLPSVDGGLPATTSVHQGSSEERLAPSWDHCSAWWREKRWN